MALQQAQQVIPFFAVEGDAVPEVAVEGAAGEEFCGQVLVEYGRAEVEGLFADEYLFEEFRFGDYPSETESGGEYLGEAAEVQGAFRGEGVYGGDVFAAVAKFAVGAVFDDQQVLAAGELHQCLPFLQGHRHSRRIAEVRDYVDELRPSF